MIRLLIVEDEPALRKGLHMRFLTESDFDIVGEVLDADTALTLTQTLCPDVVLIDVDMPLINGMALANQIHSTCPQVAIVIISHQDNQFIRENASRAGFAAFVAKSTPSEILVSKIRQVTN